MNTSNYLDIAMNLDMNTVKWIPFTWTPSTTCYLVKDIMDYLDIETMDYVDTDTMDHLDIDIMD